MSSIGPLLFIILGGSGFLLAFGWSRYFFLKLDTQLRLISSIFFGIITLATLEITEKLLFTLSDLSFHFLRSKLVTIINPSVFIHNEIGLSTLLLILYGPILGFLLNLFGRLFKKNRTDWLRMAGLKLGDELDKLFWELTNNDLLLKDRLVLFTLKNYKIYIGIIKEMPDQFGKQYIGIIPILSGYRNKDNHEVIIINDYLNNLDSLNNKVELGVDKRIYIYLSRNEIITFSKVDLDLLLPKDFTSS